MRRQFHAYDHLVLKLLHLETQLHTFTNTPHTLTYRVFHVTVTYRAFRYLCSSTPEVEIGTLCYLTIIPPPE